MITFFLFSVLVSEGLFLLFHEILKQAVRNVHMLKGNPPSYSRICHLLQKWRLHFSENTPKGFEKFFKPGGAPKNPKEAPKEAPKEPAKNASSQNSSGSRGSDPDKKFSMKYEFKFGSSGGK